ncbi:hypothetical protein DM01DRAFT_334194 [Hesseltinella vesiculosa]|uniref:PH domain-containing protein n=1 Tax=Hesseltinella vesiculosa TaxID=101127 RepID=A0A1X2G5I1_9FUNG|nr:hypothetical protein DM01DRAFT_334194 [Hesseltinella vesiculosa]
MSTLSLKNVVSKSFQHLTQAGHLGRSVPRKIAPHFPKSSEDSLPTSSSTFSFVSLKKKLPSKSASTPSVPRRLDPIVHYNGPQHTLEQLPDEKWQWIRQPSLAESQQGLQNPLSNCDTSIMFRKPHRSQNSPMEPAFHPRELKPKAMFYLRGIQLHQESFTSAYTPTDRCGKQSVQANLDETFLFDVDEPCQATLSIYAKQRSGMQIFQQRSHSMQQDTCVGQHHFNVDLRPSPKHLQREVIVDVASGQTYQILVVYGVYISQRCQTVLNQTLLMEDFLTIQVRGTFAPRLERFWVVIRGIRMELYDFDFKESRPPIYVIPLDTLEQSYHGTVDDEHEQPTDAGGLVLQFSQETLGMQHRGLDPPNTECRMFVLAESMARSKDWENTLNYVASIFEERRQDYQRSLEEGSIYPFLLAPSSCNIVPAKFLW